MPGGKQKIKNPMETIDQENTMIKLKTDRAMLIEFFEDLIWQATNGTYGNELDWEQARESAKYRVQELIKKFGDYNNTRMRKRQKIKDKNGMSAFKNYTIYVLIAKDHADMGVLFGQANYKNIIVDSEEDAAIELHKLMRTKEWEASLYKIDIPKRTVEIIDIPKIKFKK